MPIETGWLIEIGQAELLYLSGFSITNGVDTTFSPNASEGLRFARAQDAEYLAGQVLDAEVGWRVAEYQWGPEGRAGPIGRVRPGAEHGEESGTK